MEAVHPVSEGKVIPSIRVYLISVYECSSVVTSSADLGGTQVEVWI